MNNFARVSQNNSKIKFVFFILVWGLHLKVLSNGLVLRGCSQQCICIRSCQGLSSGFLHANHSFQYIELSDSNGIFFCLASNDSNFHFSIQSLYYLLTISRYVACLVCGYHKLQPTSPTGNDSCAQPNVTPQKPLHKNTSLVSGLPKRAAYLSIIPTGGGILLKQQMGLISWTVSVS